jgi:hypothetical protein
MHRLASRHMRLTRNAFARVKLSQQAKITVMTVRVNALCGCDERFDGLEIVILTDLLLGSDEWLFLLLLRLRLQLMMIDDGQ